MARFFAFKKEAVSYIDKDSIDILVSLLTGLVAGAISAVVTYFATRSKIRLDLTVENDKKLRDERLRVYKDLWVLLKPLARYSPEIPLTYQKIKDTSEKMRNWYFDEAKGIYLSKESRKPYFELKKSLQQIIDREDFKKKIDEDLTKIEIKVKEEKNFIRKIFNKGNSEQAKNIIDKALAQGMELRRSLSEDIGTRKEPFL